MNIINLPSPFVTPNHTLNCAVRSGSLSSGLSKNAALAREVSLLCSVDGVILFIAFDFVGVSDLFALVDLVTEGDLVALLADLDHVPHTVFAKVYLD